MQGKQFWLAKGTAALNTFNRVEPVTIFPGSSVVVHIEGPKEADGTPTEMATIKDLAGCGGEWSETPVNANLANRMTFELVEPYAKLRKLANTQRKDLGPVETHIRIEAGSQVVVSEDAAIASVMGIWRPVAPPRAAKVTADDEKAPVASSGKGK